jgi:hypothetical protein
MALMANVVATLRAGGTTPSRRSAAAEVFAVESESMGVAEGA